MTWEVKSGKEGGNFFGNGWEEMLRQKTTERILGWVRIGTDTIIASGIPIANLHVQSISNGAQEMSSNPVQMVGLWRRSPPRWFEETPGLLPFGGSSI